MKQPIIQEWDEEKNEYVFREMTDDEIAQIEENTLE
jgi:hypothetical protein